MRVFKIIGLLGGLLAGSVAHATTVTNVSPTTVKITFEADPVLTAQSGSLFNFGDFIVGERVRINVTMSATPTQILMGANSRFDDAGGSIVLSGLTSGTSLDLSAFGGTGVRIRLQDGNVNFETIGKTGLYIAGGNPMEFFGPSYIGGDDFASLLAVLASPTDVVSGDPFAIVSTGTGRFWVGETTTVIPLPAGGLLLLGGLGALALRRRAKS